MIHPEMMDQILVFSVTMYMIKEEKARTNGRTDPRKHGGATEFTIGLVPNIQ